MEAPISDGRCTTDALTGDRCAIDALSGARCATDALTNDPMNTGGQNDRRRVSFIQQLPDVDASPRDLIRQVTKQPQGATLGEKIAEEHRVRDQAGADRGKTPSAKKARTDNGIDRGEGLKTAMVPATGCPT